ncbi:MAG: MarR family winged helix-turn-helix transcriptional regulator [Microthrixaceae bacterium]
METQTTNLRDEDFRRLLAFRDGLRRFHRWSEEQAKAVGLTPAQHQLLLAVRGHGSTPSIREVAEHLMLRHHSVVELIDRASAAGLVERRANTGDQRVVRLAITDKGEALLDALANSHIEELSRLRHRFESLWADLPQH